MGHVEGEGLGAVWPAEDGLGVAVARGDGPVPGYGGVARDEVPLEEAGAEGHLCVADVDVPENLLALVGREEGQGAGGVVGELGGAGRPGPERACVKDPLYTAEGAPPRGGGDGDGPASPPGERGRWRVKEGVLGGRGTSQSRARGPPAYPPRGRPHRRLRGFHERRHGDGARLSWPG